MTARTFAEIVLVWGMICLFKARGLRRLHDKFPLGDKHFWRQRRLPDSTYLTFTRGFGAIAIVGAALALAWTTLRGDFKL